MDRKKKLFGVLLVQETTYCLLSARPSLVQGSPCSGDARGRRQGAAAFKYTVDIWLILMIIYLYGYYMVDINDIILVGNIIDIYIYMVIIWLMMVNN
jgi:hypothetical protein